MLPINFRKGRKIKCFLTILELLLILFFISCFSGDVKRQKFFRLSSFTDIIIGDVEFYVTARGHLPKTRQEINELYDMVDHFNYWGKDKKIVYFEGQTLDFNKIPTTHYFWIVLNSDKTKYAVYAIPKYYNGLCVYENMNRRTFYKYINQKEDFVYITEKQLNSSKEWNEYIFLKTKVFVNK